MTRLAVIGAGAMGRNHVRVCKELAQAELVGVSDTDREVAARVATLHGTRAYASYAELLERERPDAVVVAVPTSLHYAVVKDALEAGCDVLVEKPIAATLEEATALGDLAARLGRVLTVGHIERYNPAVLELKARLNDGQLGRLIQVHARRLGPFPARVRDVGVVVDLATHDLDLMRYLTRSEVLRVYAETKREIHTSREDLLNGLLRFKSGVIGVLEINWLTPTKIRELFVTGERGMFRVDYLTQDLYFFENAEKGASEFSALSVMRGVSEGAMTRFPIEKVEPLRTEQQAFLRAIAGDRSQIVDANDARSALCLALALIESGERNEAISL